MNNIRKYADEWAYDIKYNNYTIDGVMNEDVINQSIEMILSTPITSRIFNLNFGSNFSLLLFDSINDRTMVELLQSTVDAIHKWEDRIEIITSDVSLTISRDHNSVKLYIPYYIKYRNIRGEFSRVITK